MVNWARDYLEQHSEQSRLPFARMRHGLEFLRPGAAHEYVFCGAPAHYLESGNWQAIDTQLVYDALTGAYGAPGLPTRIKADGLVNLGAYLQQTTRVGLLDMSTRKLAVVKALPVGTVNGDRITRETGLYRHELILTETGLREELTLLERPNVQASASDWLVLETAIMGASFADGWLAEYQVEGARFPLPKAHDARGDAPECRRYARTVGGTQYLYTGIPAAWLASATYPVVIDPDYAADSGDGYVQGVDGTYNTARGTSSAFDSTGTVMHCGQHTGAVFVVKRCFVKFDTSAIDDGYTVTSCTMTLTCTDDFSTTNFSPTIVKCDWSGSDPLAAGTRETAYDAANSATADQAWRSTNGMSTGTGYTSPGLDTSRVSKTGSTYFAIRTDREGTEPGDNEFIYFATQNHATAGYRPIITVLASAPAATKFGLLLGVSR